MLMSGIASKKDEVKEVGCKKKAAEAKKDEPKAEEAKTDESKKDEPEAKKDEASKDDSKKADSNKVSNFWSKIAQKFAQLGYKLSNFHAKCSLRSSPILQYTSNLDEQLRPPD